MCNTNSNEPKKSERSVFKDAQILKTRCRDEVRGGFPALQPRFSLLCALALFWGYAVIACGAAVLLLSLFDKTYSASAAFYAAPAVFAAGSGFILCSFYCKKRYGALIEMLLSSAFRTGVPLAVALVFYFIMDKILLKSVILTLAVFYVLALPFEVWVTLPGRQAGSGDGDTLTKDESLKNER